MITLLAVGIALALMFEGAAYALFPGFMRRVLERACKRENSQLRTGGLIVFAAGLVLFLLMRF